MSRSTGLIPPFPSSSSSSPQQHQPSNSNNPFLSPAPSPSHQHQQPLPYGPRAISPAPGGAISRQSSMESMHSGRGGGGGGYGAASPMLYSTHQPLLYSGSAGQVGSMSTLGGGGGGKNGEKGDVMGFPSSPSSMQGGHDKMSTVRYLPSEARISTSGARLFPSEARINLLRATASISVFSSEARLVSEAVVGRPSVVAFIEATGRESGLFRAKRDSVSSERSENQCFLERSETQCFLERSETQCLPSEARLLSEAVIGRPSVVAFIEATGRVSVPSERSETQCLFERSEITLRGRRRTAERSRLYRGHRPSISVFRAKRESVPSERSEITLRGRRRTAEPSRLPSSRPQAENQVFAFPEGGVGRTRLSRQSETTLSQVVMVE